jgi:pyridoxal phosphate enzyme (YggS family)
MTNDSLLITHYHQLLSRIRFLEAKYQRPHQSINLLAVSKSQPLDKIRPLIQAGQLHFGENYVQEALNKISAFPPLNLNEPLNWHYIGQLQSNKLRAIATYFNWVQTVTSFEQAKKLNLYRSLASENPGPLNICIQVNISRSASKHGVLPDLNLLEDLLKSANKLPNIILRGLMAIPEPSDSFEAQYLPLKSMAELFAELQSRGLNLDTLSMGMSQDLEAAIKAGSTLLRVGTALFGPRESST